MINQKEITILNIYSPKVSAHNFIKQTLLDIKAYITPNTIIVGDFNTPLLQVGSSSRENVSKETSELIEQNDLTNLQNILPNSHRIHILLSSP
jgi:hypothetical protein